MNTETTTDLIGQRLGFGCGRLKGGHEKATSLRLVHAALDLGIRHFDTAPPYGLGASEPVLGEALKGRQENVTVFTKAGLARPASPSLMQTARAIVKPLANRIPGLRKAVLKGMAQRASSANFNPAFIAQSFDTSQRLLQRERIDSLLLHEPQPDDDLSSLRALLDGYVAVGRLGSFGSSTGDPVDRLVRFGTVWQYRYPEPNSQHVPVGPNDILHGAFRFIAPSIRSAMDCDAQLQDRLESLLPPGVSTTDAYGLLALAYALAKHENRLLFSTNQPDRLISTLQNLRNIIQAADWRPSMQVLSSAIERN